MDKYKTVIEHSISELKKYEQSGDQKVQFSYLGAFDENNLQIINQYIDFAQSVNFQGRRTNLFKIFVELTQNISQNSTMVRKTNGRDTGSGKLIIQEYESFFIMESCNPCKKKNADIVIQRCKDINGKSIEELRDLKRKLMRESSAKSQNGNVGLITVAILTKNDFEVNTKEISEDEVYLSVTTKLNK